MNGLDENRWAEAFAIELMRLGARTTVSQMVELGHTYFATEGTDDPVEVARREFLTNMPDDT